MQGVLYEEPSFWLFVLVTIVMGGWAAWMTGRAIAITWRPTWQVAAYTLLLGLVVRFIHFALFHGTLLSLHYYIVDTAVLLVVAYLGWRRTRMRQMTTQYPWLYEPAGPLAWRAKQG